MGEHHSYELQPVAAPVISPEVEFSKINKNSKVKRLAPQTARNVYNRAQIIQEVVERGSEKKRRSNKIKKDIFEEGLKRYEDKLISKFEDFLQTIKQV